MLEKRDYQDRICQKAISYISQQELTKQNGTSSILIESPTGSGKTVICQKICKELNEYSILWMAHRTELRTQAEKTNNAIFKIPKFETISMFDRDSSRFKCGKLILVIDECQHSTTNSAIAIINELKPNIIIGLTATPYRLDRAKLIFEKVIRDAGIRQLIREGWLTPFNHFMSECEWTPNNIAQLFLESPEHWGPSVSYFHRIHDAKEMATILKSNGIAAEAILGDSAREDLLDAFDKGEITHLTNCEVLTEGFDAPKLKTVFIRPGSKGPTIQMAGRVLRKHESTPITNIIQNIDTKFVFTKQAESHAQFTRQNNKWIQIDNKNVKPIIEQHKILRSQIRGGSQLERSVD